MDEHKYMYRALELAQKGIGYVNPNPCVGAVIVKEERIIGEGWHEQYGGPHAEVNALNNCRDSPEGATIYVTLEPCSHYGKTPPCADAIIKSGIKKVVIGSYDPNNLVAGQGIKRMKESGIEVVTGILEKECTEINEIFFHYIDNNTPFVMMKYAMTLDGKISTVTGESKWITKEKARENVHRDRNRFMGIMVGIGTILKDDPLLTCRLENGKNPIRIICDTNLRTPLSAQVVKTTSEAKTIIATCCEDKDLHKNYIELGCEILVVPMKENHIDMKALMIRLGENGIDSILLEGGAALNYAALESRIVHKIQAYIAPKIFGGSSAKTPVEGKGIASVKDCYRLKNPKTVWFGDDFMIESEVEYLCSQE